MPGTKVVTGFGLRDVAVAARPTAAATTPTWVDVPSVDKANFKLEVSEVEQWGDDIYQGTFYHSQKGKITVVTNKLSMNIIERLSGVTASSASGAEDISFGTDLELNPPRLMVRGIIPVRRADGTAGTMTVYWYNCTVKTVWDSAPGNERAKLMEMTYEFDTFPSYQDEKGDTLTGGIQHAFGRISVN